MKTWRLAVLERGYIRVRSRFGGVRCKVSAGLRYLDFRVTRGSKPESVLAAATPHVILQGLCNRTSPVSGSWPEVSRVQRSPNLKRRQRSRECVVSNMYCTLNAE